MLSCSLYTRRPFATFQNCSHSPSTIRVTHKWTVHGQSPVCIAISVSESHRSGLWTKQFRMIRDLRVTSPLRLPKNFSKDFRTNSNISMSPLVAFSRTELYRFYLCDTIWPKFTRLIFTCKSSGAGTTCNKKTAASSAAVFEVCNPLRSTHQSESP